ADRNSIACQTKCPGRLLQRGWPPQERRSLAWATRWQASIRHDDRRSRARWNVDGDHKSSIWFSTTDGARELVSADVALSGNHCERFAEFAAEFVRLKVDVEAVIGPRTQWSAACPPARCERPRGPAAEQRDELAAPHDYCLRQPDHRPGPQAGRVPLTSRTIQISKHAPMKPAIR